MRVKRSYSVTETPDGLFLSRVKMTITDEGPIIEANEEQLRDEAHAAARLEELFAAEIPAMKEERERRERKARPARREDQELAPPE